MPKTTLPKLPVRTEKGALLAPKSLRDCRFPRTVARVSWDAGLRCWITRVGRYVIATGATKSALITGARTVLRKLWVQTGIPGQLWVQNRKTGQFSKAEATYGLDPRGPKG